MKVLVCIGLLLLGSQLINSSPIIQKEPLRFNSDGKFKILNFADLHYGEFPGTNRGRWQDGNSTRVMNAILDFEYPDFVVFTGDLMTSDAILFNSTRFIHAAFEAVSTKGYKWGSTYGNHDNGAATTREQVFAAESEYANSYTQHGPTDVVGLTNYFLPIYPQEGETPALILWFFDSRGGFDPSGIKPSNVDETVVAWFKVEDQKISDQWGKLPALAFFHIPTLDYKDVQADMGSRRCEGLVDEAVVPQGRDTGFMKALVNSTVLSTFVGHDHGNSWCCEYERLDICYNRRTGHGGYGDWDRGARVVELDSARDMWTEMRNYVRLEDGSIVDVFESMRVKVENKNND